MTRTRTGFVDVIGLVSKLVSVLGGMVCSERRVTLAVCRLLLFVCKWVISVVNVLSERLKCCRCEVSGVLLKLVARQRAGSSARLTLIVVVVLTSVLVTVEGDGHEALLGVRRRQRNL